MIRILMADDHPVVLEGIKRFLSKHTDIQPVGEASDGTELLRLAKQTFADVALVDISMPGPGISELIAALRREQPKLFILVVTGLPETQFAMRVFRAGARGYVTKDALEDELVEAIRIVAGGRRYIPPSAADLLVDALTADPESVPHELLSDRELSVLRLSAVGKAVKEIAVDLGISPKTVSTYRRRILVKLGVPSQAAAILYALEHDLIETVDRWQAKQVAALSSNAPTD